MQVDQAGRDQRALATEGAGCWPAGTGRITQLDGIAAAVESLNRAAWQWRTGAQGQCQNQQRATAGLICTKGVNVVKGLTGFIGGTCVV
jgi:hypothetical protein